MYRYVFLLMLTLSGVIHQLQQRASNREIPSPKALSNCRAYNRATQTYGRLWFNQAAAYFDPILNPDNIAAFMGTQGEHCDLFIQTFQNAYLSRPLATQIFRITLGLNPDLRFCAIEKMVQQTGLVAATLPLVDSIAIDLNPTIENNPPALINPSNALRHEIAHKFIDMYNKRNNNRLEKPEFVNAALSAFAESMKQIDSLRVGGHDGMEIIMLKERANTVRLQLNHYLNPATRAEEIFTHLIHLMPEHLIKKYFKFFHDEINTMLASFKNAKLQPHGEAIASNEWYNGTYIFEMHDRLTFQEINLEDPTIIRSQVHNALNRNDVKEIEYVIKFFADQETVTRMNALKKNPQTKNAYVSCHLLAATCNDFLGNEKTALHHLKHAWKVAQELGLGHHSFSYENLMRMNELQKKFEDQHDHVKPLTGSTKRETNRMKKF